MSTESPTVALLLLNLGTPDAPETGAVRRYLREFLSDPRVIDIPAWKRFLILNLFILPRRPRRSAEAYRKVWTERGSPLLFHGLDLQAKVQQRCGPRVRVELAMRYGRPSIESALDRLQREGIDRVVCFPLYPQYASSTTGSSIEAVSAAAARRWNVPYLQFVPPFYDHPAYLEAFAARARPVLAALEPERLLVSFHGLPERQLRRGDPTGARCLLQEGCCDRVEADNRACYRAQCYATARALAARLDLAPERYVVAFQSRLGREPWLRPYTDETVERLAREGVRRVAVMSPAFVADCLETLEELGLAAAERFTEHGGERLELIPSLNADDAWARAVVQIARESSGWLREAAAAAP